MRTQRRVSVKLLHQDFRTTRHPDRVLRRPRGHAQLARKGAARRLRSNPPENAAARERTNTSGQAAWLGQAGSFLSARSVAVTFLFARSVAVLP